MLMPRTIGHMRPRAGGDQDDARGDRTAIGQPHRLWPGEGRALVEDFHRMAVQRVGIGLVEPVDLGQHIIAQPRPIKAQIGHIPAEIARVRQILGKMGAIDEQLLGHAAANDAGAADAEFLGNRHPRAVRGGDPRGAHPARSGANHEQVIVEIGHQSSFTAKARAIRSVVEGSKSSPPSAAALAISLPSSTPNWSNGLMPSNTALTKVRCS